MSSGDYLNVNEVETGGLQAANFVNSPVSNPIFNIHTPWNTTSTRGKVLIICVVFIAAIAIGITVYPYTTTESKLGETKNNKGKLDLRSIMSSPRTGILSLIRFNSGQD